MEHERLDYLRDVTISSDQPPLAQVVHERTAGNPFFGIQFRQIQLLLEMLNDVLEFRGIFRNRLDQGLVSFQHCLRPGGAVFFQRYAKSLPGPFCCANPYVEKLDPTPSYTVIPRFAL